MSEHLPVMAAEVVEFLVTRTSGGYVDCTVGAGGHARQILNNAPEGTLLGLDLDAEAIERAATELAAFGERVALVRGNFSDLATIAEERGFRDVDGVLFDLGFSSMQLDDPSRGFSYRSEGPIDMRLNVAGATSAGALLLRVSERELAKIIFEFGEERRAHPIARSIIAAREDGTLETTADLAAAIVATRPKHRNKTLSRVFQALRIAVNGELDNLSAGLAQAVDVLRPGGRVAVISYHSLEDRMVKRHFVQCENPCTCPRDLPECVCGKKPTLKIVTRRIVTPGDAEVAANPRARSAKLRVAEKLERQN
ncbi:MAG: 16S rRNA (cytosine(1402)-N(4))-methyltransferase RsmH [Candidatus Eisenbacteria bacterium]|nr:16S rRNA (cytosine(1402)-N(4))-methyltransferase RsmH [Candidatus Eisenbacteria bacterium]